MRDARGHAGRPVLVRNRDAGGVRIPGERMVPAEIRSAGTGTPVGVATEGAPDANKVDGAPAGQQRAHSLNGIRVYALSEPVVARQIGRRVPPSDAISGCRGNSPHQRLMRCERVAGQLLDSECPVGSDRESAAILLPALVGTIWNRDEATAINAPITTRSKAT